ERVERPRSRAPPWQRDIDGVGPKQTLLFDARELGASLLKRGLQGAPDLVRHPPDPPPVVLAEGPEGALDLRERRLPPEDGDLGGLELLEAAGARGLEDAKGFTGLHRCPESSKRPCSDGRHVAGGNLVSEAETTVDLDGGGPSLGARDPAGDEQPDLAAGASPRRPGLEQRGRAVGGELRPRPKRLDREPPVPHVAAQAYRTLVGPPDLGLHEGLDDELQTVRVGERLHVVPLPHDGGMLRVPGRALLHAADEL